MKFAIFVRGLVTPFSQKVASEVHQTLGHLSVDRFSFLREIQFISFCNVTTKLTIIWKLKARNFGHKRTKKISILHKNYFCPETFDMTVILNFCVLLLVCYDWTLLENSVERMLHVRHYNKVLWWPLVITNWIKLVSHTYRHDISCCRLDHVNLWFDDYSKRLRLCFTLRNWKRLVLLIVPNI